MSPLSSPEVEERLSSHPISPTVATPEVPKASDRTQVEAKEVRLSDMPPVTLVDNNVHTKTDDIAEMNIAEDLDNRPSKKAKISESGVLEPSSMSPTMSASTPVSECSESIVPESDNQIDHDPLQSPPSPSSSTLSPVLTLHDVKEPDSNKEIKVDETYDYLPQVTSTVREDYRDGRKKGTVNFLLICFIEEYSSCPMPAEIEDFDEWLTNKLHQFLQEAQMAEEEGFFSFMECMMARENVPLEKGYGLMDWLKLNLAHLDLSGVREFLIGLNLR